MANETQSKPYHHRKRYLLLGLGLLVVAGAGVAWASQAGWGPMACHRGGHGMMKLHAEFIVDRALKQVEATDEQRQQVEAVVQRLMAEHETMRAQHEQVHQELVGILTADTIDRGRLETLRAQQVTKIEQASRQLTQAIGDVADALTPEQRKKLVDWAEEMHK